MPFSSSRLLDRFPDEKWNWLESGNSTEQKPSFFFFLAKVRHLGRCPVVKVSVQTLHNQRFDCDNPLQAAVLWQLFPSTQLSNDILGQTTPHLVHLPPLEFGSQSSLKDAIIPLVTLCPSTKPLSCQFLFCFSAMTLVALPYFVRVSMTSSWTSHQSSPMFVWIVLHVMISPFALKEY